MSSFNPNNPAHFTTEQIPAEPVWYSYEEYLFQEKWEAEQTAAALRQAGLGWLVDFCSQKIDSTNS